MDNYCIFKPILCLTQTKIASLFHLNTALNIIFCVKYLDKAVLSIEISKIFPIVSNFVVLAAMGISTFVSPTLLYTISTNPSPLKILEV